MKNDFSKRFKQLSPEQRELLIKKWRIDNNASIQKPIVSGIQDDLTSQLSSGQERMWFLHKLSPKTSENTISSAFRIMGEINISALQKSFLTLINRHQSLRTIFVEKDNHIFQTIAPAAILEMPITKVDPLNLRDKIQVEAQKPFDLSTGPLLRTALLCCSPEEHVLVINMHHIISDGWSMGIILKELSECYDSYTNDKIPDLSPLELQYSDYSRWEANWLSQNDELSKKLIQYWKNQLSPPLPITKLPNNHKRPSHSSGNGKTESIHIPISTINRFQTLINKYNASLYMGLLAVFKILLFRYSHETDIVIGTPVANRRSNQLENTIGFFVNTLVLRTSLDPDEPFAHTLKSVKKTALEAFEHQELPFNHLVKELNPERSLTYNPLFQIMFAFHNESKFKLELYETMIEEIPDIQTSTPFDLSVEIWPGEHSFRCAFKYSTDLFQPQTITSMSNHFVNLLENVLTVPERAISQLNLLSEKERDQLLYHWNETSSDFPQKNIPQLFDQQAKLTPLNTALVYGKRHVTYEELNQAGNRIATHILKQNLPIGTSIGVLAERSIEYVMAILGVLKSGNAFLPLDSKYPAHRIAHMLNDSKSNLLLVQEKYKSLLDTTPFSGNQFVIENWISETMDTSPVAQVIQNSIDSIAYTIFTSGTSGIPKAIQISHKNLVNLITWHNETYKIVQSDKSTILSSISFDASIWEIFPYLLAGSTLFIPNEETRLSPQKLFSWLNEMQITITFLSTPIAEILLDSDIAASFAHLRSVLTGGDQLTKTPPSGIPFKLYNHYGPTENTVITTASEVMTGTSVPTIGKPISNTHVYILDAFKNPTPVGILGDLFISGIGLTNSYLNNDSLSSQCFLKNPFNTCNDPCHRNMYKTGDIAKWLPTGEIEFIGRTDDQIQILGQRIETKEIETCLSQYAQIKRCCVIPNLFPSGHLGTAAYYTSDYNIPSDKLFQFMNLYLPKIMIPQHFIHVDEFKLTENDKIDKQSLPPPKLQHRLAIENEELNDTEKLVRKLFRTILNITQLGKDDSFFNIGGNSLLLISLSNEIEKTFSIQIPLITLMENPTISNIANEIETYYH